MTREELIDAMKEAMEDVFHDSYGEATFAELAAAALDASTITRLTAERDEARAECERLRETNGQLRAIIAWNTAKSLGASDDAAYEALRKMELADMFEAAKEPGRG